jgi:hypothetical protein
MTAAERVIRVAANRQHLVAAQAYFDSTDGLAQVTGAVVVSDVCFSTHGYPRAV